MTKKSTLLFCVLVLWAATTYAQQITVTGRVTDALSAEPLSAAKIMIENTNYATVADSDGSFALTFPIPESDETLIIEAAQHDIYTYVIAGGQAQDLHLGEIILIYGRDESEINAEDLIPTITLSNNDLEDDLVASQNISGILTASNDVFVSAAAFQFGPRRFRIRGLDSENSTVFFNGVPMNDIEIGRPTWFSWSGLNDVTRNRINSVGLAATDFDFGGAGGASFIDARPSVQRKQIRASYASSNRSYRHRLMATASTGMQRNGWGFTLSGSLRWADEGYIEGTDYEAYSYFGAIERKINDQHSLSLTVFGAPNKRGRSTSSTLEFYDLAGSNFYNPYWGYQNGEKRNSRVRTSHQPVGILTHHWKIGSGTTLLTSVSYQSGRNGSTAIDWFNAQDPRPDYYRNSPDWVRITSGDPNDPQAARLEQYYRNNPEALQIDWDRLYAVNRNTVDTFYNPNGAEGEVLIGKRANYVLEERRYDSKKINFNTNLQHQISGNVSLQGGVRYQYYNGQNFKLVEDLLGADFAVDIDQFAQRDSSPLVNPEFSQNDLANPNRIVREGDRWGYDYESNIHKASAWLQAQVSLKHWELFAGIEGSNTRFWRTGNRQNGRFPNSSFGDSEKATFTNFGFKGGATYKLDGRNYVYVNAMIANRAPYFRNSFILPRVQNRLVPDLTDEKITSLEGGYQMRSPKLKARATAYLVNFQDRIFNRTFFFDGAITNADGSISTGGFVNYLMTDMDIQHQGLELAADYKLSSTVNLIAVAALGNYVYNSRPNTFLFFDRGEDVSNNGPVYLKDFKVPGTAQSAYTFGINYRSPKFWFLNINVNYIHRVFLDIFPERRNLNNLLQTGLLENLNDGTPLPDQLYQTDYLEIGSEDYNTIFLQEKAEGGFSIDLFGGKSFKVNDHFIYLTVGVSNILNDTDFVTGGYEQFRYRGSAETIGEFPNKYFYAWGTNYFAQIAFRL